MAKSPIGKTANIVIPLIGIGAVIAIGFAVYKKFFAGQTQEEQDADFFGEKQSAARDAKGALQNTIDFIFGEKTEDTGQLTANPQTANVTPNLNGGGDFFGGLFSGISSFFFPKQEGESSPTIEKEASDKRDSTTDPSGASTSADPESRKGKRTTPSGFQQLPAGQSLRELQVNTKKFGTQPKRGGRLSFGSSAVIGNTSNPTTSNKSSATTAKKSTSKKQIAETPKSSRVSSFISRFSTKPAGTSRTSPKSSGSPTSSTSTTEKPKTSTPTNTTTNVGRRRGNTQNKGTITTGTGETKSTSKVTSFGSGNKRRNRSRF